MKVFEVSAGKIAFCIKKKTARRVLKFCMAVYIYIQLQYNTQYWYGKTLRIFASFTYLFERFHFFLAAIFAFLVFAFIFYPRKKTVTEICFIFTRDSLDWRYGHRQFGWYCNRKWRKENESVCVCVYECSNNDKRHGKVDDLNKKQHF